MSAIKSAVCLTLTDGSETEESFHADEREALRALGRKCIACFWSHTGFIAGETIIYEVGDDGETLVIGTAQVRMLGY